MSPARRCAAALLALLIVAVPGRSSALSGTLSGTFPVGTCTFIYEVNSGIERAYVINITGGTSFIDSGEGGEFFAGSIEPAGSPITTSTLESCGLSEISGFTADGPNGTFAEDDAIDIKVRARDPDGNLYDYQFGLVGRDDTTLQNARKLVSDPVAPADDTARATSDLIAAAQQARLRLAIAAQPDLTALAFRDTATGATVTRGGATVSLGSADLPVWATLSASRYDQGDAEGSYILGAMGAHADLGWGPLVGVMVETDRFDRDAPDGDLSSSGWLAGPYLVGRAGDLTWDLRALWGRASNDIRMDGAAENDFDSRRRLAMAKVGGSYQVSATELSPYLAATWADDRQEAYRDEDGTAIPEQTVRMRELALGLDLSRPLGEDSTLSGGVALVGGDASRSGAAARTLDGTDGLTGRAHLGLSHSFGPLGAVSAGIHVDGLGSGAYTSGGLDASLALRF